MEHGTPIPPRSPAATVPAIRTERPPPTQLPPQPTRLIDRDEELRQLGTLLSGNKIRLLTLTGPGGVGKTRLVIAAAARIRERFPDGVWFVDLTPLSDPALVVPTIARVLGVREAPGRDLAETLAEFLSNRVSLLLLDNLEHLLAAAAAIDALLAACPGLTILATSREPLHLRREQVVEVQPLPVPGPQRSAWTIAGLAAMPAIELFVDRARAAHADFALSESNVEAVAELSRHLDGLPLAMELAAARTRVLEPSALLARMEHSLSLLRWDAPDLPPRHRTLRSTLDWSYALLTPEEQAIFRRLGVFAGGFTLEAASAVAAAEALGVESLEVLQGLVDKHLVQVLGSVEEEPRFGQLVTVRDYAQEQLVESGEAEETRHRHLTYHLALAEQAQRAIWGPDEELWLSRLDREVDNLRLAQDWAITRGDTKAEWRLVAALGHFWVFRGYLKEGAERSSAALSRSYEADPVLQARFLEGAGLIAQWSGDNERAVAHFESSLRAAKAAAESVLPIRVLGRLGAVAYAQGDATRARALFTEKLELARAVDSRQMIGQAFLYLVLFAIGPHGSPREWEHLRTELEHPVVWLREAGSRRGLAILLAGRARLLIDVDAAAAFAALREALTLARGWDDPLVISFVPWLATVLLAERLPADQLARLGGGVAALAARSVAVGGRDLIDVFGAPRDRAMLARMVASARATLGEAAFAAAEATGSALTFEQILGELMAVLEDGELGLAPTLGPGQTKQSDSLLSPREREVLALVVEGRSNKAIAEALFVAPSTIKTHVSSILTKLGADNRAELATIAVRRGLLTD